MNRAIAEYFNIEELSSVPYLYRYLVPALPIALDAAALLRRVVRDEAQRRQNGDIALIGRRILGIPTFEVALPASGQS